MPKWRKKSLYHYISPLLGLYLIYIYNSPAAHGGRPMPMGWVYRLKCMQYTWRGTPHIALPRDASANDFFPNLALSLPHWHPANTPNHSRGSPLSSYNIWQNANIVGTLPKVPHPTPYLTSVTKIGPEKAHCRGYLTLTFDLGSHITSPSQLRPFFMPHMEVIGQTVQTICGRLRVCGNVLITAASEKAVNNHS